MKVFPNYPKQYQIHYKLGQQEKRIERLHIIYLILLGVSVLVGVGAVRLAGKKRLKRIR